VGKEEHKLGTRWAAGWRSGCRDKSAVFWPSPIVPDREKSGVSGPIRSIKMCSCVQCAMQEESVCCRNIPCLAHVEQKPDPLHPGVPTPLVSAWPLET
jgi:hypothetical protein